MKLGFIGAGNMASAIIKSLIKAESKFELLAFDVDFDKLSLLSNLGVTPCKNIANLASDSDYIVLAVKPQNIEEVLVDIKSNIKKSAVVISIAAGITAEYIKKELGYDAKVVLVMPNTPLMLGVGATALAHIAPVSDAEFNNVRNIFDCAGITAEVASDKMKEIIAINGSSPAFIYAFAKAFVDYAVSEDIDENEAKRLFSQTLIGSAKMITDSGNSLDKLIEMVSSKGGTTIAGLSAFEELNLNKTVNEACTRCTKRAYELSK